MRTALYYLGLACLFTHELDAVTHSEWRLLPVLRGMTDAAAQSPFVALHVPLFFVVLWLSHHHAPRIRTTSRVAIASFLVLHAVVHFASSSSPQYDFNGVLSLALIASAGACGGAYLALGRRHAPGSAPPEAGA